MVILRMQDNNFNSTNKPYKTQVFIQLDDTILCCLFLYLVKHGYTQTTCKQN